MKRQFLKVLFIGLLMSIGFYSNAQDNSFAERWATKQTKMLTEKLEINEKQAKEIYNLYYETTKKNEEIKQSQESDKAKSSAIWRANKERDEKISQILTPEQNAKLKEIKEEAKLKK